MKFATSTELSTRILAILADPQARRSLPESTAQWLEKQENFSALPRRDVLLCESFPRAGRHHLVLYGFAGQNAHQTLGLLISKQMEERGLDPLGFLAMDHAVMITSLAAVQELEPLLDRAALARGLQDWLAETSLMKRGFRSVATIAGLIQRNQIGARKTGKQATFSSDIIYDTLRRHDPDHILLRATYDEARRGLIDFGRIEALLDARPKVDLRLLPHVSPLAAPLLLELGRVKLNGAAQGKLAQAEARALMLEAALADG